MPSYYEVQRECAKWGFTETPMTELEYKILANYHTYWDLGDFYSAACDLNAGFSVDDLCQ